ncbi:hypothetical protein L1857_03740 [Amycolatopsis thermalba]|uniref:Uncharacterized protein n=1 Tax=Amycolatopsis thermalba TaxID=944492 RepID=A0ABY4NQD7_9PSEU|nr:MULTISPECIES: hypothetical protein [Amycolatopsis]UQS21998.1 hypothetical protein L1857_03740 [Amycolatopsis thermalba]
MTRGQLAFGMAVAAVAALVAVLLWEPSSTWQVVAHTVLTLAWTLLGLCAVVLVGYRRGLRRRLSDDLRRLSGPGIVDSMAPKQLLDVLLSSIYGRDDATHDVVTGLLGRHLAVSTHTEVDLELTALSGELYELRYTCTYRFRRPLVTNKFVLVMTSDAEVRDSLVAGIELPLFDLWFFPDRSGFDEAAARTLASVRIACDYLDAEGNARSSAPVQPDLREVPGRLIGQYLKPELRRRLDLPSAKLHVFECDLGRLAGRAVRSIERLEVRVAGPQHVNDGYCYWQPPFPCYVEQVRVNAGALNVAGRAEWQFRTVPFTFRSGSSVAEWLPATTPTTLDIESWLLPGHGVAVLWRPAK